MSDWQPIETAPKEGFIDVWVKRFTIGQAGRITVEDVGRVTDARWDTTSFYQGGNTMDGKFIEGEEPEWIHFVDHIDRQAIESDTDKVTHWMPLPEPPTP